MDEANIVIALQADLQNYKVKIQIRRKESQLHILITRSESDSVDYDALYNIVKNRIDRTAIEGASSFILYGRLAGAKHPEWQKTGDTRPPLPLIELDLDELEDIGELGHLTFPIESDDTKLQFSNLAPEPFDTFKQSIENDLRKASLQASENNFSNNGNHKNNRIEDLNFGDLEEFKLDNLEPDRFDSIEPNSMATSPLEAATFELNNQFTNQRSPSDKNAWLEEDFGLDDVTLAMPLPPPPLPPTKRIPSKVVDEKTILPETQEKSLASQKSLLISGAFVMGAIAILGICGWLLWDRSVQQKYVANARELSSSALNPQTVTKLESLAETRNQLQSAIAQLQDIPDRPASLYEDAQAELATLSPKLGEFDRKINIEQGATKKIETAKNLTNEAANLVQNPPHRSTIWKSAQEKRQESLKLLGEVPKDSLLYADAQKYVRSYRVELAQISKRVEIQQKAETLAGNINPNIVNQLKQVKAKSPEKQKFLAQCKPIVQPQISNADGQRVGLTPVNLTEYLCAYFWGS